MVERQKRIFPTNNELALITHSWLAPRSMDHQLAGQPHYLWNGH